MFTLGGKALPIDLHTVWTDDDGRPLSMGDGNVQFDFRFRDVLFAGRIEQSEGRAHLKLVGDMGPMPFSAEAPAARAGLARIVEAANAHLGGAPFRVTQGRILLGGDIEVAVPVTATGLIASVTLFLLPSLDYVDLIALYVRPPLAARRPGDSAVRPEWRRQR
ncbi:conserved hypothetical protein [Magnetospirillum sp. SS-4]|nr:conserved hypothetical protein [Magnetospirillum sp. SS-4]